MWRPSKYWNIQLAMTKPHIFLRAKNGNFVVYRPISNNKKALLSPSWILYKSAKIHRYLSFCTFFWVDSNSLLVFLVIKMNPSPMYRFYFIWYITTQFMNCVSSGTTFKKYNHVQGIRQWHTFVSVDMNLCIYCYTVLCFCNQNMATENQRWVDVSCLLESGQDKAKIHRKIQVIL